MQLCILGVLEVDVPLVHGFDLFVKGRGLNSAFDDLSVLGVTRNQSSFLQTQSEIQLKFMTNLVLDFSLWSGVLSTLRSILEFALQTLRALSCAARLAHL